MAEYVVEEAEVFNITLTNANQQYSQALPSSTREFRFRCRTSFALRFAFESGKVASPTSPYLTLPVDAEYASDNNDLTGKKLYLASSEAGVVVELELWTK